MANLLHLAKLHEGSSEWNRWRMANANTTPDLSEADLSQANLKYWNLMRVNLSEANLSAANRNRAKLSGTDLTGAYVRGANLSGARLYRVNFYRANLNGANLKGALLDATVFGSTNLKDVQGLESCEHPGPSIIDHHTLAQSWPLPLPFLRGCGLPDEYIDYL